MSSANKMATVVKTTLRLKYLIRYTKDFNYEKFISDLVYLLEFYLAINK